MKSKKNNPFLLGVLVATFGFTFVVVKGLHEKVDRLAQQPTKTVHETVYITKYTGFVSYYSEDGCLGCDENQVMANGQIFDEDAMTIAFNLLPLGTKVRVTNLDNGKSVEARVTDTGGFHSLGRIADLSKGVAEALHVGTDQSIITISEVIE